MKLQVRRCEDATFGIVISQGALEIDLPFVGIWIVSDAFYAEYVALFDEKDERTARERMERYIG